MYIDSKKKMEQKKFNDLCDVINLLYGFALGLILAIGILLMMSPVSAFPLQLLQNGTIVDLGTNATINGSSVDIVYFNDSFYFIPKMNTNISYFNVTNISYGNFTNVTNISYGNFTNVTNVTLQNYTNCSFNYTYYNATGNYTYNKTELDDKLKLFAYNRTEVDAIGNYILSTTTNSLVALKNELNASIIATDKTNTDTTPIWIALGVIGFVMLIIILLIFKGRGE